MTNCKLVLANAAGVMEVPKAPSEGVEEGSGGLASDDEAMVYRLGASHWAGGAHQGYSPNLPGFIMFDGSRACFSFLTTS